MMDVVTLGEAMLMLVAEETGPLEQVQRFAKRTAGAETNVAVGLARLGLKVGWQSRLGSDSMAPVADRRSSIIPTCSASSIIHAGSCSPVSSLDHAVFFPDK